jgi:hypothetical protein
MPAAPTAPAPAGIRFKEYVREVFAEYDHDTAVDLVTEQHQAEVSGVDARLSSAEDEVKHAMTTATLAHDVLAGVSLTAQREIARAAQLYAQMRCGERVIKLVQQLVDAAENGVVAVSDLRVALNEPLGAGPFRPYMAAFVPSDEYVCGVFRPGAGDRTVVLYSFRGWGQVITAPGTEGKPYEAVFEVDGQLYPASLLVVDRGLYLQRMQER